MNITDTADLWWKTAVLYCADVQTFLDLDGDGHGDLRGMVHRVDYLADLGVTCLWLMPFYPTADRDDGYDITDFYGVDPRLGSAGDFVELVRTCHSRGIRVIIDFVMNHTSDRHPWWKDAIRSEDSPHRDWYVWRSSTPPDTSKQVVFPDQEDAIWDQDPASGQWYLHNFYKTQPDLNLANPDVREEVMRTMGYWLQLGVDGFRIDAVPFLFTADPLPKRERRFPDFDPHDYLRRLKAFADRRNGVGDVPRGGQRAVRRHGRLLRQRRRRRAVDAVRLHRDAGHLPLPGPGRRPAPGQGAAGPSRHRHRQPVGQLPAQPRRAHPRQAEQGRAPGGLRRLRPGPGGAALRPRSAATAPAHARWRRAPHPDGLLADVLAARHAGPLLRRGDRDGGEPRRAGSAGGAHAHAVAGQRRRRASRPRAGAPSYGRSPRGPTVPRRSTWPSSATTRTPCGRSSSASSPATASRPRSGGRRSRCSTSPTTGCWRTSAARTSGPWWPSTTSPTSRSRSPSRCPASRAAPTSSTC